MSQLLLEEIILFLIHDWHSDLYRVSAFQAYRTSTSCLPHDLEFFMFAVMKTFVTDTVQLQSRVVLIMNEHFNNYNP
jgi:hypothetical protein